MTNLLSKPTNELTKNEREYLRNELNEMDKDEIRKELEEIKDIQKKYNSRMDIMEETAQQQADSIKRLEKNTNVICSPFHSKRKRMFNNLCKARVWSLFDNNKDTIEYVLFQSYFFKKIYGDIASHFELDTWYDIDMTEYENEGSMYSQAKEFAKYWNPSNWYVKEKISEMINKRDNGILAPEKCRALTEYLKITNNGEINPFTN